jgi:hypothetical protein
MVAWRVWIIYNCCIATATTAKQRWRASGVWEVLMTTAKQLRSRVKGQLSRPVLKTSRLGDGPA